MTTPLDTVPQAKEASVADTTDALRLIGAVRDLDIYNGSSGSVRMKDRLDELCDAAESEVAALQAEVARLREDATRYRWLRDDPPVTLCVRQRHDEKRDLFYQYIDGSQLDAAIDAAMGGANGQGDAADTTAGDAEPEGRG